MFNSKVNVKWFKGVTNVEDLKKAYRQAAKTNHPDVNKDENATQNMKEINNEYEYLLRKLPKTAKTETTFTESEATGDMFREILEKILHMDLDIEICGTWIWIGQRNSFECKDELKAVGFKWAKQKKMWYFAGEESKSRKKYTMEQIREMHGSQKVETGKNPRLTLV